MTDIVQALQIIIARSPNASEEALRTISAVQNNSPVAQNRYLFVLQRALADQDANFTPEERQMLAEAIDPGAIEGRDYTLHIRITASERAELERAAERTGMSMSEFARSRIFEG